MVRGIDARVSSRRLGAPLAFATWRRSGTTCTMFTTTTTSAIATNSQSHHVYASSWNAPRRRCRRRPPKRPRPASRRPRRAGHGLDGRCGQRVPAWQAHALVRGEAIIRAGVANTSGRNRAQGGSLRVRQAPLIPTRSAGVESGPQGVAVRASSCGFHSQQPTMVLRSTRSSSSLTTSTCGFPTTGSV
jgi:hypothetical protein